MHYLPILFIDQLSNRVKDLMVSQPPPPTPDPRPQHSSHTAGGRALPVMSMEPWTAARPPSGCGRGSMGAQVSGVEARPVPEYLEQSLPPPGWPPVTCCPWGGLG